MNETVFEQEIRQTAKAQLLAIQWHGKQKRKESDMLYAVHLARVSYAATRFYDLYEQVAKHVVYHMSFLVAVAWLHDVLEDCDISAEQLKSEFGQQGADIVRVVSELTSDPVELEKQGKGLYLAAKMNRMSVEALFIKLLDRRDNITDYHDCARAKVQAGKPFNPRAVEYAKQTLFILENVEKNKLQPFLPIVDDITRVCNALLAPPFTSDEKSSSSKE